MRVVRFLPVIVVALLICTCSSPTPSSLGRGNIYGALHFGSSVYAFPTATASFQGGTGVYSTTMAVTTDPTGLQQATFRLTEVPPGTYTATILFTCSLNALTVSYVEAGETGTPTLGTSSVLDVDGVNYDWTCTLSAVTFPSNLTIDFYVM